VADGSKGVPWFVWVGLLLVVVWFLFQKANSAVNKTISNAKSAATPGAAVSSIIQAGAPALGQLFKNLVTPSNPNSVSWQGDTSPYAYDPQSIYYGDTAAQVTATSNTLADATALSDTATGEVGFGGWD